MVDSSRIERQNRRVLSVIFLLVRALALACRGHHELVLDNLALRQQLNELRRKGRRRYLGARSAVFVWSKTCGIGARRSCWSRLPILASVTRT